MSVPHSSLRLARAAKASQLCSCFARLSIRSLSTSASRAAMPTIHGEKHTSARSKPSQLRSDVNLSSQAAEPSYKNLTPEQRIQRAADRARENLKLQQEELAANRKLGGLADNSVFTDDEQVESAKQEAAEGSASLVERNIEHMSMVINPRPNARAQWQRKKIIQHIRRKGRLPRAVQIARTERAHLAKSHFFKTSMKKLAPLARQIAGKSIDEAILQMRFSKKKAAIDVRKHLVQARDEAIVMRGMGLKPATEAQSDIESEESASVPLDPGSTQALPHQKHSKSIKAGYEKSETDIYVSEAWINRGPYERKPEYRARGRVNLLRPPWTGISVVLKEEKTRTREKADKEEKAIRKRLGKSMWTQLPDRPIIKQSQYVLW